MNTSSFRYILAIIPLILILLLPGVSQAQRRFLNRQDHDQRRFNAGFSLGFNQIGFAFKPDLNYDPDPAKHTASQTLGFHIGLVSNLKLDRYFDLRFVPTLAFRGERFLHYRNRPFTNMDEQITFDSTILEFPVHLKYKSARIINARAYVIGGAKYSFDLNNGKGEIQTLSHGRVQVIQTQPHDFQYELGVGFDYYFYYFKFSTEIKASFGIRDLAKWPAGNLPGQAGYYDPIEALKSKAIMISFLFE